MQVLIQYVWDEHEILHSYKLPAEFCQLIKISVLFNTLRDWENKYGNGS